jgi:hypothetical protein
MSVSPEHPWHTVLHDVQRPGGFAAETIPPGETGDIWVEGFFSSDQPEFYIYMDHLASIYLRGALIDGVVRFLAIHHEDRSVDLYVNGFPQEMEALVKRDMKKGEGVLESDIGDVSRMRFPGVPIVETDDVVLCFKRRWKFGLYFNFRQSHPGSRLDPDKLESTLGFCYKFLSFQEEYSVFQQRQPFDEMQADGWFPFIQLHGGKFKELLDCYRSAADERAGRLDRFLSSFDDAWLQDVATRWWSSQVFSDQRPVIQAGLDSYYRKSDEGYISCIKVLHSEIDGILRRTHVTKTGEPGGYKRCVEVIRQLASEKFQSPGSLGFPDEFTRYLNESFLKDFDLLAGDQTFSRHSSMHGIARAEDYTRARALQAILILDQLYFSLPKEALADQDQDQDQLHRLP